LPAPFSNTLYTPQTLIKCVQTHADKKFFFRVLVCGILAQNLPAPFSITLYTPQTSIKCVQTHVGKNIFFTFWYVELLPKVCPHLSVTPCILHRLQLNVSRHMLIRTFFFRVLVCGILAQSLPAPFSNTLYTPQTSIKCVQTHVDKNIFFTFWYVEFLPKVCPHLSVSPCILHRLPIPHYQ
jgi:hypothetical protein